jgi:pyruvate/2-oxoglutarate dehydrogenase complex dihydrolipoamide dehydrogenase (E3) component
VEAHLEKIHSTGVVLQQGEMVDGGTPRHEIGGYPYENYLQDFDAVVVATGTFNAPNIPNIPGLVGWSQRFPGSILHSREYRHPEMFANKSVLIVGAGVRYPCYSYLRFLTES